MHVQALRLQLKAGERTWVSQRPVPPPSWGFQPCEGDDNQLVVPELLPYARFRESFIQQRGGFERGKLDGGDGFYTDAFWKYCNQSEDQSEATTSTASASVGTSPTSDDETAKRSRSRVEEELVDEETTWKDVEWDEVREAIGRQCEMENSRALATAEEQAAFEEAAERNWTSFYEKHENKFFQTRHYFLREYPWLAVPTEGARGRTLMEIGCGTGSTAFPLMAEDPEHKDYWHITDLASSAIAVVKQHAQYNEQWCRAYVHDITGEPELPELIPDGGVDIAFLIFVLSAVSPAQMPNALRRILGKLRPGGRLIFRDYGLYDMVQMRFIAKCRPKLAENFYLRSDGTRAYFFSLDSCRELFISAGFEIDSLSYQVRQLKNRKRKILFHRVWVTAVLRRPAAII